MWAVWWVIRAAVYTPQVSVKGGAVRLYSVSLDVSAHFDLPQGIQP